MKKDDSSFKPYKKNGCARVGITMKGVSGFTLLELMVALVLGLMVSAIAVQLFLTSQRSVTMQQGMVNLQNSTLFGVGTMLNHIRLANLNSSQPFIDDNVLYGGIVLSARNLSEHLDGDGNFDFNVDDELLTRGGIGETNLAITDAEGGTVGSDQLVIQYKVLGSDQFDCEGTGLTSNEYVVERYFLREDANNRNDPNQPLVLACKATRYTEGNAKDVDDIADFVGGNLSGNGEIIIPRVDHFSVRLGVAYDGANANCTAVTAGTPAENIAPDSSLDCFSYMNIEDYRALSDKKPQIVSVQIGLLVRSVENSSNNKFFDKNHNYRILNVEAPLIDDDKNRLYLRNVVTQTIAIRNGFGVQ